MSIAPSNRTYPLSATFKHMKENAYAFYPYFGRREIFLNAVSIRHNKHSRFLSTVCAHAVEHLLLSDHPRDFAPISAETRRKSSLIRAFLSRFTHSSEDMNSAIYSKYSHRHNEQIYSSVEPTSSSLFEGVRKRSVQTSIRFEPKKRVSNYCLKFYTRLNSLIISNLFVYRYFKSLRRKIKPGYEVNQFVHVDSGRNIFASFNLMRLIFHNVSVIDKII